MTAPLDEHCVLVMGPPAHGLRWTKGPASPTENIVKDILHTFFFMIKLKKEKSVHLSVPTSTWGLGMVERRADDADEKKLVEPINIITTREPLLRNRSGQIRDL